MFRAAVYCEEVKIMGDGGNSKVQAKPPAKGSSNPISKIYLILYNLLQTFGWLSILLKICQYFLSSDSSVNTSLYDAVKQPLIIYQNLAVLEILHAAVRIVPSSPIITAQQVTSRVIVVCGVLIPTLDARESVGLVLLLLAWSVTEIIRYLNYALSLLNSVPYFIIWLRYSTFIFLYPIGVTGELLCIYAAQKEARETKLFTIEMPNPFNVLFYYDVFLIFVMLLYIPLFPQLYMHMFRQRRKVLGAGKTAQNGVDKKVK